MGQITLRALSENLDIAAIAERARTDWEKSQRRRAGLAKHLTGGLPLGLVILAVMFFLLTAPHTMNMMDKITPGFGVAAPIGIEIGIIIIAALMAAGWNSRQNTVLLYMLLVIAILLNFSGGMIAIIEAGAAAAGTIGDTHNQTLQELVENFGLLPATYQITLIINLLTGPVIPVVSKFIGEGVIGIALGHIDLKSETSLDKWAAAQYEVTRSALYRAALESGATALTAMKWADRVTEGLFPDNGLEPADAVGNEQINMNTLSAAPSMGFASYADRKRTNSGQTGQSGQDRTGQNNWTTGIQQNVRPTRYEPQGTVKSRMDRPDSPDSPVVSGQTGQPSRLSSGMVRHWIRQNGDLWERLNDRDISIEIIGVETGERTVRRVRKQMGLNRRDG